MWGPPVHFGPSDVALTRAGDADVLAPPTAAHPFGTDSLGRDLFARLVYGTRTEFGAALLAVTASLVLGTILGALAGFAGGVADAVVTRLVEALTAVPTLLLLLVVQALVQQATLGTLLVAYAATRWTEVARLVRVEVLRVGQQDYVLAARALGASPYRILRHHVAPNARSVVLVAATFGVAQLILTEAALDFLRIGTASAPSIPTWGESLAEARDHVEAWWLLLYPGLAIFVTLLVLHRIGDVLRDALDPRTARRS
jgi:ABC-type dipeptide/oligopeptide/nickel transport system permease subunit